MEEVFKSRVRLIKEKILNDGIEMVISNNWGIIFPEEFAKAKKEIKYENRERNIASVLK